MPIDTQHPSVMPNVWRTCRDVAAGEDALKARKSEYIPVLEGLAESDPAFAAYCNRATFYPATSRTVVGLTGLVLRKPAQVVARKDQDLDDLSGNGLGLGDLSSWLLSEVLTIGRGGVLVDWNDVLKRPTWTPYCGESITNWREELIDGVMTPSLVVLREELMTPKGDDPYSYESVCQYREYQLLTVSKTGARVVGVRVWQEGTDKDGKKSYTAGPWAFPFRRGELIAGRIPFVFFGPNRPEPKVAIPPLYDLVRLNLSHYRTSADHEHALHFVALPTPYVTGWNGPNIAPNAQAAAIAAGVPAPAQSGGLKVGSGVAWIIPPPEAKVGMLEFTGQGLGAIEKALERKEGQMSIIGSRLLEGQPNRSETAEAVRIRRSGEGATLSSVTRAISLGLTDLLRYDAWWRGTDRDAALKLTVTLNQDYLEMGMDAQTVTALVGAWQAGAVSKETLYWNFQQGEIARPNVTFAEEQQTISTEEPADTGAPGSDGLPPAAKPPALPPADQQASNETQ
jgi:hypothetical protein